MPANTSLSTRGEARTPRSANSSVTLFCEASVRASSAGRVRTPVLLFQAELDTLVSPKAQEIFLSRIPDGRLAVAEGARHEIYRSQNGILEPYLEELFGFYGEHQTKETDAAK